MMTDLEPHELEQVRFWSDVMVKDLFGHSYVFDILNLWKFDTTNAVNREPELPRMHRVSA